MYSFHLKKNEYYSYSIVKIHKIWMNDVISSKVIVSKKGKGEKTITINSHDVSNNAFAFIHDKMISFTMELVE